MGIKSATCSVSCGAANLSRDTQPQKTKRPSHDMPMRGKYRPFPKPSQSHRHPRLLSTDRNSNGVWDRVMKEFIRAEGERFTEHDLRGKVATDIEDPYLAQQLLAHSSIKTTEGYIKQRQKVVVHPHSRKKS